MVENAQMNMTRPEMWDVWIGDPKDGRENLKWKDIQARISAAFNDAHTPAIPFARNISRQPVAETVETYQPILVAQL
jgi:hypothetical protein